MFDIGLEVIRPKYEVPADWSMEQGTELFYELNTQLDAVTNLITIRQSIQKYGKTPQLMDLVGASFEGSGITFSNEGIVDSIKKFFKWIKDKIVALWKWFWGLFGFYKEQDKKEDAALEVVEEVATAVQKNDEQAVEKAKGKLRQLWDSLFNEPTGKTPTNANESLNFSIEALSTQTIKFRGVELSVLHRGVDTFHSRTMEFADPSFTSYSYEQQLDILNRMVPTLAEFKIEMKENFKFKVNDYPMDVVRESIKTIHSVKEEMNKSENDLAKAIKIAQQNLANAEQKLQSNPNANEFKVTAEALKLRIIALREITIIGQYIRKTVAKMTGNMITAFMNF